MSNRGMHRELSEYVERALNRDDAPTAVLAAILALSTTPSPTRSLARVERALRSAVQTVIIGALLVCALLTLGAWGQTHDALWLVLPANIVAQLTGASLAVIAVLHVVRAWSAWKDKGARAPRLVEQAEALQNQLKDRLRDEVKNELKKDVTFLRSTLEEDGNVRAELAKTPSLREHLAASDDFRLLVLKAAWSKAKANVAKQAAAAVAPTTIRGTLVAKLPEPELKKVEERVANAVEGLDAGSLVS